MSAEAEALLQKALSLPEHERADIAAELLASLDVPATADPATVRNLWSQEIERRARRTLAGGASGEDWDSVRQRLADQLTNG